MKMDMLWKPQVSQVYDTIYSTVQQFAVLVRSSCDTA